MSPFTVADILRSGFDSFVAAFGPQPLHHLKVVSAITNCRTLAMGGFEQRCDSCGHLAPHYYSCRNRHCPQCQSAARALWIDQRMQELLPVGYFHVVFTIPAQLYAFALRNKKTFYNSMFRAVKETLLELAADPKRLGADIGFVCVLHTWGQTLVDHPHIHCIVPGGGFDSAAKRWKPAQNGFLFPVAVMRALFRGKLMAFFTQAVKNGDISLNGTLQQYRNPVAFAQLLDELYRKEWVVYAKRPFASAKGLVKYLGAYTHRIAISNKRILSMENNHVTFSYKDYADQSREKRMRVPVVEFIRRFMLHIMPGGFRRIRYYGFLAARARITRLAETLRFFHKNAPKKKGGYLRSAVTIFKELLGFDPLRCRQCLVGTMQRIASIPKLYVPVTAT